MRRFHDDTLGLGLDLGRMGLTDADLNDPALDGAVADMAALEAGAIANPDEGRQVGHYWLRAPELAPKDAAEAIRGSWDALETLSATLAGRFDTALLVGIGGSALGPMFLADALGVGPSGMALRVLDNTDPDGFDRVLAGVNLGRALTLVFSKSGGTQETRNGMLEVAAAYRRAGLNFAEHAVALTCAGSALDREAEAQGWLARLPMWDWVGGRTSVTSLVGLLPLALLNQDWRAFLDGAAGMDAATRGRQGNPALGLALAWHRAAEGQARRAMVVLPYKDRLVLFSRYLQQLVMESIGKERDLAGQVVHQGLTVYGNKGSTDQHAYIQQLREGPDDVFATFIAVLEDRQGPSLEVSPGVTAGDYLLGFLLGTRNALSEAGRRSLTITLDRVGPRQLGALIALFERAVGYYASLVGVNAYHQPGVEAGKKAAGVALRLQAALLSGEAEVVGDDAELIVAHLQANGRWRG